MVDIIRNSDINKLQNEKYVEKLIIESGLNNEKLHEQPKFVSEKNGGLRIWQYPNQFSKYMVLLSSLNVKSYIEIGCRWGGTFIFTTEYLKKINNLEESIAFDRLDDTPVIEYCKYNPDSKYINLDSHSKEFFDFMNDKHFDVIFIDGDHSYNGVKMDYTACKNSGRIFVFHDIVSDACPGVVKFWNELKQTETGDFFEFTDQYEDVNGTYLGIGVFIPIRD